MGKSKKKEAYKSKKKNKKGWFSGLGSFGFGNTEETKSNVTESGKQGAILVVGTLAGGLAGAAIGGATALYGGIATMLGGLFMGSDAVVSAGGGMMIGSAVKPTPVQNANLQQKNAEADMPIDKTRNKIATGASAFLQNMKDNSMVNKVLPTSKETKAEAEAKAKVEAEAKAKAEAEAKAKMEIKTLAGIGKQGNYDVSKMLGNIENRHKSFVNTGLTEHDISSSL